MTSLSTPTLESSGRQAATRSSTSESDGSGAGGSSRMFEMFLENNGGFIEPTKLSQTESTRGAPRWLLEAVRPQVHLEHTDGQHDQDRGDSVDGEALDSVDDEEVRDELIPPLPVPLLPMLDSVDDEEEQDDLTLSRRPHHQHDEEQKGVMH
jgi:hypothetical protein